MHPYTQLSENADKAQFWNEIAETMPREKLNDLHLRRLKSLLEYAYKNNQFYKKLYDRNGLKVTDIQTLEDFKTKVPLTDKPMIQDSQTDENLYGENMATDSSLFAAHYATSGTTGKSLHEVWEDYGIWRVGESYGSLLWNTGLRPSDSVYFAFDFGRFAGFWSTYFGVVRFGAKVISGAGVGLTSEQRVQQIIDLKPTAFVATPTYALHLANVARKMGVDPSKTSIKFHIGGGEPGAGSVPKIRERLEKEWGCKCGDAYGISELPSVSPNCKNYNGIHEQEMNQFSWVRDIVTGKEVSEGEVGERIITSFGNYSTLWINYRSHDLVRPSFSCPCGCTWMLYNGGILGRTDNIVIYKGTNVYQTAVENVISSFPEASDYFQLVINRKDDEDYMSVRLELAISVKEDEIPAISEAITRKIKKEIGVTLPVEIVPSDSLPRYQVKTKRIFDERPDEYKLELAKKIKTFK